MIMWNFIKNDSNLAVINDHTDTAAAVFSTKE